MIVKIYLTVSIDEDEYPIPSDGDVSEEVEHAIEGFVYDIDGMKINNLKVIMENKT
tara:strand:+ start:689 stop:856 length:168 start_codon:yes stop_codon:yes gene_type:complete